MEINLRKKALFLGGLAVISVLILGTRRLLSRIKRTRSMAYRAQKLRRAVDESYTRFTVKSDLYTGKKDPYMPPYADGELIAGIGRSYRLLRDRSGGVTLVSRLKKSPDSAICAEDLAAILEVLSALGGVMVSERLFDGHRVFRLSAAEVALQNPVFFAKNEGQISLQANADAAMEAFRKSGGCAEKGAAGGLRMVVGLNFVDAYQQ